MHIQMALQTDSLTGEGKQVSSKQSSKHSNLKISVQSLRHFDEINSQYLNYCPTQQLIQRLEHKLTILRFVFDLHQSIVIKQRQRYERVGFPPININKLNNNNSKDSMDENQNKQSNQINNQRLKNVIVDNLFYEDFNRILLIKTKIENEVKIITKHLYGRVRDNQKIRAKLKEIYGYVENNRYGVSKSQKQLYHNNSNSSQNKKCTDQIYHLITPSNFQSFISLLYLYLVVEFGNISLYDFLKELTQRWICDIYKYQQQRYFNLLNQMEQRNVFQQNEKQLSIRKGFENERINEKNALSMTSYELAKQRKIYIQEENKELAFLQLLNQTKIKIRQNALFQSAVVPIDYFNKPCCNTLLYKFSRIHSNKYSSNPKNNHLIFITKQSIGLQDSNQSQKQSFKTYQLAIKQATAALLNNNGGFIFVGFKKQGLYYSAQCPFLLSENMEKEIKKKIVQSVSKEITILTGKDEKQQIPYRNIHVDFIPVLKRRGDFKNVGKFFNDGQYVWRIRVEPIDSSKLKIHSIMDVFYDIDSQNQTYFKLNSNSHNKDAIYDKLRSMMDYNVINRVVSQVILKYNPYRVVSHCYPCIKLSSQTHFIKQNRQSDDHKKKNQQSIDQNRKKNNQKSINAEVETMDELRRNIDSGQEQKAQFKQINLIVLQNKNIKESCQKYFSDKKIQVKIQKLENQTFKKLTKQTYIIYHHKKFDEINTQLSEFKKKFNSKKNISLISAEKSVSVDCFLDRNQLQEVQRMAKKEIEKFEDQNIAYVEQTKDNQSKSYLKAESKKAGIYLYFILSELNLKAKMKNVPANLHNKLVRLDQAIIGKEDKPAITKNSNQHTSQQIPTKGQKNVIKSSHTNQNNQPYMMCQQQQFFQPYFYTQYQTQDPNYNLYKQTWLQHFITIYNDCAKGRSKKSAVEEFNKILTMNSNSHEFQNFMYYQINNQPFFQRINQQVQRDYYNRFNYQSQFPQQPQ